MTNKRLPMFWASTLALCLISLHPGTTSGTEARRSQDASAAALTIQLEPVLTGLSSPVHVTHAGDGSNRLFIVEQPGTIKVLQPGATAPTVFLDIVAAVLSGGEQGLLGLAFHPDYETNRRFFVNYTRRPDGATVIAEYRVSTSNPNIANTTEAVLLVIPQPFANHNGGMIAFGPDGYLYIGMGDGGSANDPGNRAQNINDLLGKILRIDIDHPNGAVPYSSPADNPFFGATAGRDEIYALGMRNPWRFSFDHSTGALYVGDVGQGQREEVDIVTKGGNYGWRVFEGTLCTGLDPGLCSTLQAVPPITEYSHAGGRCSITGGYVYRGQIGTLPTGTYVFADYCTGEIFMNNAGTPTLLLDTDRNISSFGEDEAGELYVIGLGGTVERIINPTAPCAFAISPTSKLFLGTGGSASVLVTTPAGCPWTATSNTGFSHVTSGSSGTGRGLVSYSVDPIGGTSSRTGTMTVAGHTFTITQTADTDSDGIPDVVEALERTDPNVKDNDVFANTRLFVMQQYRDFLDREGEAQGIAFWTNSINSGSQTRAQVVGSFFNSQEFQGSVSVLTRLYFASFQRIPDYGGLTFWVRQYRNGATLDSISQAFVQSPEFQQTYGALNNSDFVTLLYNNVLGRQPDPEGHAFWTAQLDHGTQSRGQVMLGFSESAEYKQVSFNKVYVSSIYSGMLRRSPEQSGFDFWLNQMNAGTSGLQLIQQFLDSTEYHDRFLPPL